jgi:hypothetical protein
MVSWTLPTLTLCALLISGAAAAQSTRAHPVIHNIGSLCRWQKSCMAQQQLAMQRALNFVAVSRPASWRVHLCNRNASRAHNKMDWAGFDACIRNKKLKRPKRR